MTAYNKVYSHLGNQKTRYRRTLLAAAILSSIGTVNAQQTSPDDDAEEDGEVVEQIEIRGIRASSAENLATKRLSNAIVDAITAEDIGKFPDKNVADALQRVPGVLITRNGGEGSTVSIRGLGPRLTLTQLNGNYIASSPGAPSRSFSFELLPSNLVGQVEVFKTPEARIDEGGIGGTIVVHSRKPLDMERNSGAVNLEYTYADVTDKYEPQLSGIYSWKNEAEDFGVLVGYVKQDRLNRSQSSVVNILNSNFSYSELRDGQPVEGGATGFSPQSFVQNVIEEDRERTGIQFTTQWRPTDNLELGVNYFQFTLGLDSILHQLEYPEWHNNPNYWTDVSVNAEAEYVVGIDYSVGAGGTEAIAQIPRINGEFVREESTSDTFDFFATYEADSFEIRAVAGHTESEGGPTEKYRSAYYSGSNVSNTNASRFYGWRFEDKSLITYIDPAMHQNLLSGIGGQADIGATDSSFETGTQEEDYAQFDVDWFADLGVIEAIRFGAKYRKNGIRRDTRNTFYLSPDFDIAAGEAEGSIDLDDDYSRNGGIPLLTDVIADQPLGNISGAINTNIFPAVNWHRYAEILNQNFVRYTRFEDDFVYEVEEEIFAAYVQADYQWGDFRGNFGVRFVDTTTTTSASDRFVYALDRSDDQGNPQPVSVAIQRDTVIVDKEQTDTEILPSFNIVWDFSDDWVARVALARTLARPSYNALGRFQSLVYRSAEWAADSSSRPDFNPLIDREGWTGSGGNSTLKPETSDQFDFSLEYYYGEGSGLSFAYFYKEVDGFSVPLQLDVQRNVPVREFTLQNGNTIAPGGDIVVTDFGTTGNGGNATSKGFEIAWQHFFENGFGIYTNYTDNEASSAEVEQDGEIVGERPFVGSADYSFNLSAFYENEDFSVRASYVETGPTVGGQSLLTLSSGETLNFYTDTYDQIDVNASYNITEQLTATASVINLTKSESYAHVGNDTKDRFLSNGYGGRRFFVGLNYRF